MIISKCRVTTPKQVVSVEGQGQQKPDVQTTNLQDFVPLSKIGQGSFSSVYKVRRNKDGLQYALKKIKIAYLKKKQKQSALNQVRILASLQSKYIINYKQAFFDQKYQLLCIVMELANQGDLYGRVKANHQKRQLFAEQEIWKAIGHITKGLKALHDNNIMHRDIKSSNIFICNNIYKLGDLNVSKIQNNSRKLAFTQTGTPYYASPEVWRDQPYDFKSDIWSLGCIIFEMCQLKQPFGGDNMEELYQNIQKGNFNAISPYYSPQLVQIINKCLSRNARFRPSCSQLISIFGHNFVSQKQQSPSGFQTVRMFPANELLKTIQLDQNNLANLKNSLPKPKYDAQKKIQSKNSLRQSQCQLIQQPEVKTEKQIADQKKIENVERIQDIKKRYRVKNYGSKAYFKKQRQKTQIQQNYSNEKYQKRGRSVKLSTQNSHRLIQSNDNKHLDLRIRKRQLSNLLQIGSCPHKPKGINPQTNQKNRIRPKISSQAVNRIRALKRIQPETQNYSSQYLYDRQLPQKESFMYKNSDRYKNNHYSSLNESYKQRQNFISDYDLKKLKVKAQAKMIDFNPKIKNHIEHKLSSLVRSINSRSQKRQSQKNVDKQQISSIRREQEIINRQAIRSTSSYLLNPQRRYLQLKDNNRVTKTDVSISNQNRCYRNSLLKSQRSQKENQYLDFDDRQYRLGENLLSQTNQYNRHVMNNDELIRKINSRNENYIANRNVLSNIRRPYIQKVYPSSSTNQNHHKIDILVNKIPTVSLIQNSAANVRYKYNSILPKNTQRMSKMMDKNSVRREIYESERMIADRYFRKIMSRNID